MKKSSKKRWVVVRGQSSGASCGVLMSHKGQHVVLTESRRLWFWSGAASLSELAQRGVSKPEACKFPAPVDRHEILDAIEILDVTAAAKATIDSVKPWSA